MRRRSTREAEAIKPFFDSSYYLSVYADVAAAGCDPLAHYCASGWREGRNPNSEFDTQYYLRTYHDVAAAGMNPLFHYAIAGRAEGRRVAPVMSVARRRLRQAWEDEANRPDDSQLPPRLGKDHILTVEEIEAALSREGLSGVVIAVSHDDYAVSVGGVQNILGDECLEFRARGLTYLHLCPARPVRGLAQAAVPGDFLFALRCNGEALGRADDLTLQQALVRLAGLGMPIAWTVHHLMGHAPETVGRLVQESRAQERLLWAHDFFAACPSYTLLRNDVAYCGGPAPDSGACRVCAYGSQRRAHMARMRTFVETVRPTLVTPSDAAADLWQRATGVMRIRAEVLAPATIVFSERPRMGAPRARLRVAFVGSLVFHKGWQTYLRLADGFRHDERYEFFQLGSSAGGVPAFVRHVPVQVTASSRDAMVHALAQNDIDVVISWSVWPETFCFTAHEAMASGAFLVARREQGHVPVAAQQYAPFASRGLESEEELHDFFHTGAIQAEVGRAQRRRGILLPSMGSAELLMLPVEAEAEAEVEAEGVAA